MSNNRLRSIFSSMNIAFMALLVCTPWIFAWQGGMMFNVNDDVVNIMLFREVFGAGSADTSIFVSSIFTDVLIFLYQANSAVPWYPLLVCACLFVSHLVLFRLIVTENIAPVFRVCLLVVTTVIVLRLAIFCSFTASAIMLSNAVLLYGLSMPDSKQLVSRVIVFMLLAVGFLLRPGIFPVILLAFAPALMAAIFSKACSLRAVIQYCLLVTAVVGVLHIADLFLESDEKIAFKQANSLRATFSDYAWGSADPDVEAASFAAGWNSADYYVAKNLWWYLDENIHSSDSFGKFAQFNTNKNNPPWSSERLAATFLANKHLAALFIILMVAWLITERGYRHRWLWIVIFLAVGSAVLLAGIRLPPRVAYPFFLMLMLSPLPSVIRVTSKPVESGFLQYTVLLAILAPLGWVAWNDVQIHQSLLKSNEVFSQSLEKGFEELSKDNTDMLFVPILLRGYSEASFIRPFQWKYLRPTIPSGWIAQSPVKDPYLKSIGFETDKNFIPQLLARKNVVFYFRATKNEINTYVLDPFFYYLNSHYGDGVGAANLVHRRLNVQRAGAYYWWFFQIESRRPVELNQ